MRLLANRSKRPLNETTERLKNLTSELKSADKELKNVRARQHRMTRKLTEVLIEKNSLEAQSEELHRIYMNKIQTLDNVEKARSRQMDSARKQEEDRVNLFHVLNGDGDEASEKQVKKNIFFFSFFFISLLSSQLRFFAFSLAHNFFFVLFCSFVFFCVFLCFFSQLKLGLLSGIMKGKTVTARANLLKKSNDELIQAFEKMMEVAADQNIISVTEKFLNRNVTTGVCFLSFCFFCLTHHVSI